MKEQGEEGIVDQRGFSTTELLVTTFHELRSGRTAEGQGLEPMSTVMSTAEAVSSGYAAALQAYFYDDQDGEPGTAGPAHLVQNLVGSALKDDIGDDRKRLRHYFDHVVRARKGEHWRGYYRARKHV